MARHLDYAITFDAPPAEVHRQYTNREYWDASAAAYREHTPGSEITHFSSDRNGTQVFVKHHAPPSILPAILRAVLPIDVIVLREQILEPFDDAGNRAEGSLRVYIPVTPIQLAGTFVLTAAGTGSRLRLSVDCKARIPLIGGKIEEAIVSEFHHFFDFEEKFMGDWIAKQRLD